MKSLFKESASQVPQVQEPQEPEAGVRGTVTDTSTPTLLEPAGGRAPACLHLHGSHFKESPDWGESLQKCVSPPWKRSWNSYILVSLRNQKNGKHLSLTRVRANTHRHQGCLGERGCHTLGGVSRRRDADEKEKERGSEWWLWWCSDSCAPVAPPERGSIGHKECGASPVFPYSEHVQTAPAQFNSSQELPTSTLHPPPSSSLMSCSLQVHSQHCWRTGGDELHVQGDSHLLCCR